MHRRRRRLPLGCWLRARSCDAFDPRMPRTAKDNPTVLADLVDRRHPSGCQGLFATLDAALAALFAGPHAGCWRDAVGSALSPARRHASRDVYDSEDEPNVKRSPGGLRDLQRALWANACTSGRSMPLKPARPCRRTASCGGCGVICTCSRVGQKTVSAVRSKPASHAGSAWRTHANRVHCSISFDITPAISSLRSKPHREAGLAV